MGFDIKEFHDRDTLNMELAGEITGMLMAGIRENNRASLAVSGGRTPVDLFRALSNADISWGSVTVLLVDERWVEPDDDDSNERLVRCCLLKDKAAAASFIGMKNSALTALEGEEECEKEIGKVARPFDALVLGMGMDGHTASLFPGAARLAEATKMDSGRLCMAITPMDTSHERMSLTLPAILSARKIFLHITGDEKKTVLQKAMENGPAAEMPIRFVLRQEMTPVEIFWAP